MTKFQVHEKDATIPNRQVELDKFCQDIFMHPQKDRSKVLSQMNLSDRAKNEDKFKKLWNGDTSDYQSRSEADFALCSFLAHQHGNNKHQIDKLFRQSGLMRDKWDEMRGEETYGQMTIRKVIEGNQAEYKPVFEKNGMLYKRKKRSKGKEIFYEEIPITSFLIYPIESILIPGEGETLKVLLKTNNKEFNVFLPPDCWISAQKFMKLLPTKETTFTGVGTDVQNIRAYLSSFDMPHKKGIRTSGFFEGKFITEEGALSAEGRCEDIIYLNEVNTNCNLISANIATPEEFKKIRDCIDKFNVDTVTLPILGWTVACFFKPIIHEILSGKGMGNGFPLLNIQGEAGSGKTSTIKNIVMRIWVITNEPKSIGELTKFTMMKLVNGSNAIPVIFEENKSCMQNDYSKAIISNLIRSTYNCLEGERGRADQTTQIYRYQAPVAIVGETGFSESALLDRFITVFMSKKDSSPHLKNFKLLRQLPLEKLGRNILQNALIMSKEDIEIIIDEELQSIDPTLADRPKINAAICRFGLRILKNIIEINFDRSKIDDALKEGVLEEGSTHRKSSVDKILEALCLMSESREEDNKINYHYQEHLEEGVDYKVQDENTLIIWVSNAYPIFKKWAKSHGFEGDLLNKNDFAKQLKKELYCKAYNKSMRIGVNIRKCAVLDITKMKEKGLELSPFWGVREEPTS